MLAEPQDLGSYPAAEPRFEALLDDKYTLLRELGTGAAGTVYEAEHLIVGKRVAIKLMHRSYVGNEVACARFVDEARAAARIGHANVVDIYDIGRSRDGAPYLVMELLRGETLEQIVDERGAVSPAYACELVLQVLAGLGAAHALGIVHRDLKPENVMVTHPLPDRPLVKILDFGIAKGLRDEGAFKEEGVLGTPTYMAPEQALGRPADARADVYAAGAILYELLSGEPPFSGDDIRQVLSKVITGRVKPLAALNPAVPRALCHAVTRAMARDPNERFASVDELAHFLWPYASLAPMSIERARSGEPIPLVGGAAENAMLVFSYEPGVRPRDFPSLGLARVEGKPRGAPVADSLLARPVIPKAPAAPRISEGLWKNREPSYAPEMIVEPENEEPKPVELPVTDPADEKPVVAPEQDAEAAPQRSWSTAVLALLAGVAGGGTLALLMH